MTRRSESDVPSLQDTRRVREGRHPIVLDEEREQMAVVRFDYLWGTNVVQAVTADITA